MAQTNVFEGRPAEARHYFDKAEKEFITGGERVRCLIYRTHLTIEDSNRGEYDECLERIFSTGDTISCLDRIAGAVTPSLEINGRWLLNMLLKGFCHFHLPAHMSPHLNAPVIKEIARKSAAIIEERDRLWKTGMRQHPFELIAYRVGCLYGVLRDWSHALKYFTIATTPSASDGETMRLMRAVISLRAGVQLSSCQKEKYRRCEEPFLCAGWHYFDTLLSTHAAPSYLDRNNTGALTGHFSGLYTSPEQRESDRAGSALKMAAGMQYIYS
jgi:hypothetical protein